VVCAAAFVLVGRAEKRPLNLLNVQFVTLLTVTRKNWHTLIISDIENSSLKCAGLALGKGKALSSVSASIVTSHWSPQRRGASLCCSAGHGGFLCNLQHRWEKCLH